MKTLKRTRIAILLASLCLAFAAPVMADSTGEGQDPPDSTDCKMTTLLDPAEQLAVDLATGTVNLLLQVTLL